MEAGGSEKPYRKLRAILVEMRGLLAKHDLVQDSLMEAIDAIESGKAEQLSRSLNGAGFWGGAGSILDVILFETPWTPEYRRDVADDSRLTQLKLELLREMEGLGIATAAVVERGHEALRRMGQQQTT